MPSTTACVAVMPLALRPKTWQHSLCIDFLSGGLMLKLLDVSRKLSFACGLALAVIVPAESARAASFETLYQFQGGSEGEYPEAGLAADAKGKLFGTTFGALGAGVPGKVCSKSCGTLYDFNGVGVTGKYSFQGGSDGAFPAGDLFVQGGLIYGTTEFGGKSACGGLGCGTAFTIATNGTGDNVFPFCDVDYPQCGNGALPHAGPIVVNGIAYGTTTLGGSSSGYLCDSNFEGCGTVYKITSDLQETVLYSFCSQSNCTDGAVPFGKLLMDSSGDLYGTTQFGGEYSQGTVFKLAPDGTYTVLYSFCSNPAAYCPDGSVPEAGLVADSAGNLYGTTTYGGGMMSCYGVPGCGVIFKLTQSGGVWTEAAIHAFQGGSDGMLPQSTLVADGAGNLYGTTLKGGGGQYCANQTRYCGTVFRLASNGTYSVIYSFATQKGGHDGGQPEGTLLWQSPYLYGVTRVKGDHACTCGTLFRINTQTDTRKGMRQPLGLPPRWAKLPDRKQN
ncbi:MAG TPA: choice-of-anchor tandem repeat GloVer-containing protein [Rhizomicrobium sp.]